MRSRSRRTLQTAAQLYVIESLESKALLSVVTAVIQVDGKAPNAFYESPGLKLMNVETGDSTVLLRTNGTQAGTVELATIPGQFDSSDVIGEVSGRLLFRVQTWSGNTITDSALWTTDGTVAGTQRLGTFQLEVSKGVRNDPPRPIGSPVFNGSLYFSADGGDGYELWKSDGTAAGTVQVSDINSGQAGPSDHTIIWDTVPGAVSYNVTLSRATQDGGDRITFSSNIGHAIVANEATVPFLRPDVTPYNRDHKVTIVPNFADGSTGTAKEFFQTFFETADDRSSHPTGFTEFNGELYFAAETRAVGRELWKTDGTSAGTVLAADALPGPASTFPVRMLPFDGQLFFGSAGSHDLYRTSGSGAVKVLDGTYASLPTISYGLTEGSFSLNGIERLAGSFPAAVVGNRLIVQQMGDGQGGELRRLLALDSSTDTTPTELGIQGTGPIISTITRGTVTYFDGFTLLNGRLVFRVNSSSLSAGNGTVTHGELWSTDGVTLEQLFPDEPVIWQINPSSRYYYDSLGTIQDNDLYITSRQFKSKWPGGVPLGVSVYRTDGTVEGSTVLAKVDATPGSTSFNRSTQLFEINGDVYSLTPASSDGTTLTTWNLEKQNLDGSTTGIGYELPFNIVYQSLLTERSGTGKPEAFSFIGQFFMKLQVSSGEALFTIASGNSPYPLLADQGVGDQATSTPTISWSAASGDVARYDLYINPLGSRLTTAYRRTTLTTNSHTLETPLNDGTYEVWVRAYFTDGTFTAWGRVPPQLTIITQIPEGTPTVLSPLPHTLSHRPVLKWSAVPGAQTYQIWLSTMDSTAGVLHRDGLTTTEFVPTADLPAGRYRLWVRAKNAAGTSGYSTPYVFQIMHDPVVMTSGIGSVADTTPMFIWETPEGNVTHYDLSINPVGQRSTVTYRRNGLTSNAHEAETALAVGNYEVWVRAYYQDGSFTAWSPTPLSVQTAKPDLAPVLNGPRANSNWGSIPLSWSSVPTAYKYQVFLRDVTNNSQSLDTMVTSTSYQYELTTHQNRPNLKMTYWVRAWNALGYGPWSEPRSFYYKFHPTFTSVTGNETPMIEWQAPTLDVRQYDLFIASASNGTVAVYRRENLTTTSHTVETPLPAGEYRIWLRVIFWDGSISGWSVSSNFGFFVT